MTHTLCIGHCRALVLAGIVVTGFLLLDDGVIAGVTNAILHSDFSRPTCIKLQVVLFYRIYSLVM